MRIFTAIYYQHDELYWQFVHTYEFTGIPVSVTDGIDCNHKVYLIKESGNTGNADNSINVYGESVEVKLLLFQRKWNKNLIKHFLIIIKKRKCENKFPRNFVMAHPRK